MQQIYPFFNVKVSASAEVNEKICGLNEYPREGGREHVLWSFSNLLQVVNIAITSIFHFVISFFHFSDSSQIEGVSILSIRAIDRFVKPVKGM